MSCDAAVGSRSKLQLCCSHTKWSFSDIRTCRITSKQVTAKIRFDNNKASKMISRQELSPICIRTLSNAGFYILSGCSQPLLVTLLKEAGLADSSCQIYMLFYYIMPALFIFPLLFRKEEQHWPHRSTIYKACG